MWGEGQALGPLAVVSDGQRVRSYRRVLRPTIACAHTHTQSARTHLLTTTPNASHPSCHIKGPEQPSAQPGKRTLGRAQGGQRGAQPPPADTYPLWTTPGTPTTWPLDRPRGTHPQQGGPPLDTPCPLSRPAPNLGAQPHLDTMTGGTRCGRPVTEPRGRAPGPGLGGRSGEWGGPASRGPRGNRVTARGGPPRGPRRCHVLRGNRRRARQLWTPGCARCSGAGGGATSLRGPEGGVRGG